ncbi:hypothetical protein PYR73_18945 (plasmid) [Acinetobacter soli]|nr:hypothetical protein PX669_00180 [Acinetobacter soli]WEH87877.1 hypothetical protein PX669_00125 [Acinetobacter soli]WEI11440.1 hypothetical protein PYR73_19000 [Acinetobacter soli]WEI11450.1 hypothetical protein PYR73_18945 [Acinetobacter soli]
MIAAYLRLNKTESKKIDELSRELNKQRLDLNMKVMQESKVLHELIDIAICNVEVVNGELKIRKSN